MSEEASLSGLTVPFGSTTAASMALSHHVDPGFTLRVYAHLMPAAEGRARAAIDAALGSSAGQMRARAAEGA